MSQKISDHYLEAEGAKAHVIRVGKQTPIFKTMTEGLRKGKKYALLVNSGSEAEPAWHWARFEGFSCSKGKALAHVGDSWPGDSLKMPTKMLRARIQSVVEADFADFHKMMYAEGGGPSTSGVTKGVFPKGGKSLAPTGDSPRPVAGGAGKEIKIYAEKALYGPKKHSLKWTEGPARAKSEGIPQGQFGSEADIDFAVQKGQELGPGKTGTFDLPPGHTCKVYKPDGTEVPATKVFVKVYDNGKVHAYPLP